jgi:L-threonylcarbamoyladenylate synthase
LAHTIMANHTNLREADAGAIAEAANALRQGNLVAFPTETVYGLGADATNDHAVASIFSAKGRPRFNPLIVHLTDIDDAMRYVVMPELARALAARFWPGALTLVLPRKPDTALSLLVSAGLDSVAVRVPSHPVAHALLRATARPIAAPSANPSGKISPTRAAHVAENMANKVAMILDGGPTHLGLESTIIGFENGNAVLLRPGAVSREAIEAVIGPLKARQQSNVSSPGQLASHYAPRANLILNAQAPVQADALLAFGPPLLGATLVRNLSEHGDLTEAAANLFAMLRELDATGAQIIAVMPIPETGLGEAINDRLRRAAAPRE